MFSDLAHHFIETPFMALSPSLRLVALVLICLVVMRVLWPKRRGRWRRRQRRRFWMPHRAAQPMLQESAIEEMFRLAWSQAYPHIPLIPQYPIGPYRVDFAYVASKVVIELDGFVAHSSTRQIEHDCRRQREIMRQGWQVFRFGGREVHYDPQRCVQETHAFLFQQQQVVRQ